MASAMSSCLTRSTLTLRLRDYFTLTKPEVNLLILMTTSAGYYLAAHGPLRVFGLIDTLIGTLLVASGTATLNQWMERRWDGEMRRTANRPLPSHRVSPTEALIFGILLSVSGGLFLLLTVNLLSAVLAVSTLLSYLLIYTPLKRRTPLCTLLGAFPGATPVLIGWAGASGQINFQAWYLFAILFLWQFPHFLAIALMYRDDYARAGYRMLPHFDVDTRFTRVEIIVFTVALVLITAVPMLDRGAAAYFVLMLLSGAFFLYYAVQLAASNFKAPARKLLHASVLYLPLVLGVLIAWKR
jgi:protoheme IX farnesyltransferase